MLRPPIANPGQILRDLMGQDTVVMPGVFNALAALAAQKAGARAGYISGAAVTNSLLGVPDIGLLGLADLATMAGHMCRAVQIPLLSDADTGFGEAWNVARCVVELEQAGLAGIHIEDQVLPKKCGHLDGKQLIDRKAFSAKIHAAVASKSHPSFLVVARTDARGVEGMDAAIDRAKSAVQSGADAVFPEGLTSETEFEQFRKAVSVPLLANMTEFGVTPLISASRFKELGYEMVIFPVSAMRVALQAVSSFYGDLIGSGTQEAWVDKMATRVELYDLIDYTAYGESDQAWANTARHHE